MDIIGTGTSLLHISQKNATFVAKLIVRYIFQ